MRIVLKFEENPTGLIVSLEVTRVIVPDARYPFKILDEFEMPSSVSVLPRSSTAPKILNEFEMRLRGLATFRAAIVVNRPFRQER